MTRPPPQQAQAFAFLRAADLAPAGAAVLGEKLDQPAYRALAVEPGDDAVRVTLGNVPASCKPRDRWLRPSDAKSCCGPVAKTRGACA